MLSIAINKGDVGNGVVTMTNLLPQRTISTNNQTVNGVTQRVKTLARLEMIVKVRLNVSTTAQRDGEVIERNLKLMKLIS